MLGYNWDSAFIISFQGAVPAGPVTILEGTEEVRNSKQYRMTEKNKQYRNIKILEGGASFTQHVQTTQAAYIHHGTWAQVLPLLLNQFLVNMHPTRQQTMAQGAGALTPM